METGQNTEVATSLNLATIAVPQELQPLTTGRKRGALPQPAQKQDFDEIELAIFDKDLADRLSELDSTQVDAHVERCRGVIRPIETAYAQSRDKSLQAAVVAFALFSSLKAQHDEALKARLARIKVRKHTNPFHAPFQDFSGLVLEEMPEERKKKFSKLVSERALVWSYIDQQYGDKIASTKLRDVVTHIQGLGGMAEAVKLVRPGGSKRQRGSARTKSRKLSTHDAEALNAQAPAAGEPIHEILEALAQIAPDEERDLAPEDGLAPEFSFALNHRANGKVRTWLFDPLPGKFVRQIVPYAGKAALNRCSDPINALGDILRIGEMFGDRASHVQVFPDEDPAALSSARHVSRSAFVWTRGDDFAVANDRRHSSIVLDAKPKYELGLPKEELLWLDAESYALAQREFAPPQKRVAFKNVNVGRIGEGAGAELRLCRHDGEDLVLHFVPAFDDKRNAGHWSWIVDRDKYRPEANVIIDGSGVAELRSNVRRLLRGKAKQKPVTVEFRRESLVIDNGHGNPLSVPVTTAQEGTEDHLPVQVLGEDLDAVLTCALGVAKVERLVWRADLEGLLAIEFETPWAEYGAHIPLFGGDDGRPSRISRLLKRISR